MSIQAAQLIYGNVEAERSPRRQGGFQTLFYTSDQIDEEERTEIEARLFYFPSESNPIKRLFFCTSTGKAVMGQVSPLQETDRFGRRGKSLAHVLVFSPQAWDALGGEIWQVFKNFAFVQTTEEAFRRWDVQTGYAPMVEVAVWRPSAEPIQQDWSEETWRQLVWAALRAPFLVERRVNLFFLGPSEEMMKVLESIWPVVPKCLRRYLSFDSYFDGGNLVGTPYWAVAQKEPPRREGHILVDLARREVHSPFSPAPQSAYERWLVWMRRTGQWNKIPLSANEAFVLCQWLEGQPVDPQTLLTASAHREICEQLFPLFPDLIRTKLQDRLAKQLPPLLAQVIVDPILSRPPRPEELWRLLFQGVGWPEVFQILLHRYQQRGYAVPNPEELQALQQLLAQQDHPWLRFLLACWAKDSRTVSGILEKLSVPTYQKWAAWAIRHRLAAPHELVVAERGKILLQLLQQADWRRIDALALCQRLLETKQPECLESLQNHLALYPRSILNQFRKLINKYQNVPHSFRLALEVQWRRTSPWRRWLRKLRKGMKKVTGYFRPSATGTSLPTSKQPLQASGQRLVSEVPVELDANKPKPLPPTPSTMDSLPSAGPMSSREVGGETIPPAVPSTSSFPIVQPVDSLNEERPGGLVRLPFPPSADTSDRSPSAESAASYPSPSGLPASSAHYPETLPGESLPSAWRCPPSSAPEPAKPTQKAQSPKQNDQEP
ncbi:MAG: hypothetical protein NZ602_10635 [Thermoguttaceae bacterium]|nr:hypothetical protein [Thermoguttaceae bacterium]MDW8038953.1 hypothetical protein [Thermoguttaceae bacterium]